jgi:predicted dehydrogenase
MNTKIVQVGCGIWGKNLLRTLNSLNVLSGVFDLDKESLINFTKQKIYRGVYFDTDWEKCLDRDEVKGVVIATPPKNHFEIAMKALQHDKHIFVEKPIATSLEEAEAIVKYAKSKNLIVMVGHIFLYAPEILKLKEIINSEAFGKVHYVYTQRLNLGQIQSCGVLSDLLPHDISIIDFLLDRTCNSVSAFGMKNVLTNVEDVAFVIMDYGDDIKAHLHLSWLDPHKVRSTVVVGDKQMAVCDSINKTIAIYNKTVDLSKLQSETSLDYSRHLLSYKYGDVVYPYIETWEPLVKECQEFISCIEENRQPLSNGDVGVNVVKVLVAAQKSLSDNGWWKKV